MSCGCNDTSCETCPPSGYICIPRGDGLTVVFSVHENSCDGDLFDISSASEIVFAVFDEMGGTARIVKKLSDTEVFISTSLHEFYVIITGAESDTLVRQTNYFECRVTTSAGVPRTVVSGILKSPQTMIKDLA